MASPSYGPTGRPLECPVLHLRGSHAAGGRQSDKWKIAPITPPPSLVPRAIGDLAREVNPTVRGWINYYGRFYKSELVYVLKSINHYLMRWATQKCKRLRRRRSRAWATLGRIAEIAPGLFAHWQFGVRP